MNSCATPRDKSQQCMSSAGMSQQRHRELHDLDINQQLVYMAMSIKEIGASVSCLDRKMDNTRVGISSMQEQLLQLSRWTSPAELDQLFKKNVQHCLAMQSETPRTSAEIAMTQNFSQLDHSVTKVQQGITDLLAKNSTGESGSAHASPRGQGQHMQEDKSGAGWCQVRDEMDLFQSGLMKEFKMQRQTLSMFSTQQQILLDEFQHYTKCQPMGHDSKPQGNSFLPPPPRECSSMELKAGGDLCDTPIPSNSNFGSPLRPLRLPSPLREMLNMSDMIMPMPEVDVVIGSPVRNRTLPSPLREMLVMSEMVMPLPEVDVVKSMTLALKKSFVAEAPPAPHVAVDVAPPEENDSDDECHQLMELREDSSLASVFMNDDDFEAPAYNVEAFYWKTGYCQKVARSSNFANFTVGVVVCNAVYIGFDSDFNHSQNIYEADWIFQVCSQFFCLYFTWELIVRFLAFQHKHDCLKDGWYKFDAFLVSTMILDIWVLMPSLYIIGGSVTIPTQPLRMLRLFKLTRMARLMKAFPELVIMIKGLVRSLRAISSSMILIGLMVYVWAIMMHMLMKEEYEFNATLWKENMLGFATITQCIWTLLMDGTLMLDNAAPLMTSLLFSDKFNYILAGALFMAYALLSAMLILQMLIGVLCDVVSRVGSEQRDATAIGLVKQELLDDLKHFDGGDGKISQQELLSVMNNPKSKALLKKLNINRSFLLELQKAMFTKPGQQVTIKAILELMVMCRGDNPTTVESLAGGLLSVIREMGELRQTLEKDIKNMITDNTSDKGLSITQPEKETTTRSFVNV